jgi:hypothetical protein
MSLYALNGVSQWSASSAFSNANACLLAGVTVPDVFTDKCAKSFARFAAFVADLPLFDVVVVSAFVVFLFCCVCVASPRTTAADVPSAPPRFDDD